jgi:hypothetical protein
LGLDDTTNGFENGCDLNLQHGRMRAVFAAVRGDRVRSAKNNVLGMLAIRRLCRQCRARWIAIRAVSGRICWTEEGYDGSAQGNCQVKRAGIATYDADGVA